MNRREICICICLWLLIFVIMLSACQSNQFLGRYDLELNQTELSKAEPKILVVTKDVDIDTFDPQRATDAFSFEVIAAVTDGLYTTSDVGKIIPALAQKTEITDDGLIYTFHLREANWSSGVPVTAYDFEYAWRRLADPDLNCEYNYMLSVAKIKNSAAVLSGQLSADQLGVHALNDNTLVVTLESPSAIFPKLMVLPSFFPVNKTFAEKQGKKYGQSPQTTLYNGAFLCKEWVLGERVKLIKNQNYWDRQVVQLDGVEFAITPVIKDAVLEYEQGNTDYVTLSGELVDAYKENKEYHSQLGSYIWWLQLNHNTGKFNNANLNRAIALSFNREQIAKNVLNDGSIPAYFFVPQNLSIDRAGKDFRELAGRHYTESKERSKEYWEMAKKELGVETFSFELLVDDSETATKVANFIKSEIESTLEGVTVKLRSLPKKDRLQVIRGLEADYDVVLTRWGADYSDPMAFLELYTGHSGGELGRGGYKSPTYDKLIDEAQNTSLTEQERVQLMVAAERQLFKEAMGPIPIYQTGSAKLWNHNIIGLYYNSTGVKHIYKWVNIED